MPGDAVGVLIVDDQQPFRCMAAVVVARTTGFVLAGEAETGEDAVLAAARLQPGLVLMDIRLPGINGVEAARRIVAADPDVVVLLCSTYQIDDLPAEVAAAGFAGYHPQGSATARTAAPPLDASASTLRGTAHSDHGGGDEVRRAHHVLDSQSEATRLEERNRLVQTNAAARQSPQLQRQAA